MNEMVERIARAMVINYLGKPPTEESDYYIQGVVSVRDLAKAALEEACIPTASMVKAGTIHWDPLDGSPVRPAFDPTRPYQAMIREALK